MGVVAEGDPPAPEIDAGPAGIVHENYTQKIWNSTWQAFQFLMYVGICIYPGKCPNGHVPLKWMMRQTSDHSCSLECKHSTSETVENPTTKVKKRQTTWCNSAKSSWRSFSGSLPAQPNWCNRLGPAQTAKLLSWFSQRMTNEEMCERTGLKPKAVGKACDTIRNKLAKHIVRLGMADDEKLGSGNTAVSIDCTYITKKKNRGAFRGKNTDGHSTCIVVRA